MARRLGSQAGRAFRICPELARVDQMSRAPRTPAAGPPARRPPRPAAAGRTGRPRSAGPITPVRDRQQLAGEARGDGGAAPGAWADVPAVHGDLQGGRRDQQPAGEVGPADGDPLRDRPARRRRAARRPSPAGRPTRPVAAPTGRTSTAPLAASSEGVERVLHVGEQLLEDPSRARRRAGRAGPRRRPPARRRV